MKIDFVNNAVGFRLKQKIKAAIKCALEFLGQEHKNIMVAVSFVNAEEMQELNNRTRNMNKVTDVLSYPNFELKVGELIDSFNKDNYLNKYILLGDIAICLEQAEKQAKEYDCTLEDEVIKLVIHSTLHLMGYDHIKDEDFAVMSKKEQEIANKFYKKV